MATGIKNGRTSQILQFAHDIDAVAERYAVAITPLMQELIDAERSDGPISKQFVPDARELDSAHGELADPVGDGPHAPVPGIVHRYPDRVLLMPTKICAAYCRFCFRRETVGQQGEALLPARELAAALQYIREHEEIWEVILSGGDPLVLSPRRLDKILTELREIAHVRVVRVHTRVPLVAPEKITRELTEVLRKAAPLFVVLHANHADEFAPQGQAACARLVDAGIPMLGQSVLLRGVNDNAAALEALLRRQVENRIKPYYLHHADRANGTAHFRTGLAQGRALTAGLRGRVSGICQPAYVLDIPGGHGKSPVGPDYVRERSDGVDVRDVNGCWHAYE
ncbi:MAG: lysine-2,3-aminomutase-like protein [Woeseiaceae bacterium]|nr:lysine-2,3-aminomutase-like protein [Gammaproteobacteria bacterium]NNK26336.1 lysine-2,3-aminomutase-like protein [Woeseiaceae bacterium]